MKKFHSFFVLATVTVTALVFTAGCAKKIVKVTPLPEKEIAAPAPVQVAAPVVDSNAIIAAQIRDSLKTIYFDFDKSELRPQAMEKLAGIGKVLMNHPSVSIVIEGYCDQRGSSEYNIALGEKRSMAAKKWLTTYGVPDSRVQTVSYGEERLARTGCVDEDCYQLNRRCESKKDN